MNQEKKDSLIQHIWHKMGEGMQSVDMRQPEWGLKFAESLVNTVLQYVEEDRVPGTGEPVPVSDKVKLQISQDEIRKMVYNNVTTNAPGSMLIGVPELSERIYSLIQYEILNDRRKVLQFIVGKCPNLAGEDLKLVQGLRLENMQEMRKFVQE
jgi:hypothetical protein